MIVINGSKHARNVRQQSSGSSVLANTTRHAIKDLRYQMQDGVSQILTQLDKIRRDIGVEVDEDDQTRNSCATPFTVPLEVKDAFTELAEQICYDLSRMPVAAGLESVVYHLDRATKPTATKTQPEDWYCASVLSLMKATWLLELTTASEGYSDACSYEATDQLENKMMEWGMTIKKYTEKLEQVGILGISLLGKAEAVLEPGYCLRWIPSR